MTDSNARRWRAGTFLPTQQAPCTYAMAGDDCSLHFDLDTLTPGQQADHDANEVLTGMLQLALTGIGKPVDDVALYDAFASAPWHAIMQRYHRAFAAMGMAVVPEDHLRFTPRAGYYEAIAAAVSDAAARNNPAAELINLYMVSGSNAVLHNNPQALEISRNVNSKIHFAQHAPAFGLPVPETRVFSKGDLHSQAVSDFFTRHAHGLMLKILGLAGARNVTAVQTVQDCIDYLAEYEADLPIILQQRLDTQRYTEMTVDLDITPDEIRINNVRAILFADGIWVGNRLGDAVTLSDAHRAELLKVGEYARAQGYVTPEGSNCGVDYFIDGDDVIVTEINARWTGGLFPAEFLRQLKWRGEAIAFMDVTPVDELGNLADFMEQHLFNPANPPSGKGQFAFTPMGFSPYPANIEGIDHVFCWQIVLGDFDAFKAQRKLDLSERVLPAVERISLHL